MAGRQPTPAEIQSSVAGHVEIAGGGWAAAQGDEKLTATFEQHCQLYKHKLFNVASTYPEPFLQAMRDLIDQLQEKEASIHEAQIAIQQLQNEWAPILQESE